MAKFKFGAAPEHFDHEVKAPIADSVEYSINVKYKYRTRTQFAKLMDELVSEAEKKGTKKPKKKSEEKVESDQTFLEIIQNQNDSAVGIDYILIIADGWDLEEEFNRANLVRLMDEFPAAITAIAVTYRDCIMEGRVKN